MLLEYFFDKKRIKSENLICVDKVANTLKNKYSTVDKYVDKV